MCTRPNSRATLQRRFKPRPQASVDWWMKMRNKLGRAQATDVNRSFEVYIDKLRGPTDAHLGARAAEMRNCCGMPLGEYSRRNATCRSLKNSVKVRLAQ